MEISAPENVELSHEEYLLTMHEWNLAFAIDTFAGYSLRGKKWYCYENYSNVRNQLREDYVRLAHMYFDDHNLLSSEYEHIAVEPYVILNIPECTVAPDVFIAFAHKYNKDMPKIFKSRLPEGSDHTETENNKSIVATIPVSGEASRTEEGNALRIIDATIKAILYCFDSERQAEVAEKDVLTYLINRGFTDLHENIVNQLCKSIPEEVRDAAIPLSVRQRQELGHLKKQKDNLSLAIKATVEMTLYMMGLEPDVKINDGDMYDLLHRRGYGQLTERINEQIWQALPPKNKKPAGNPKLKTKVKSVR